MPRPEGATTSTTAGAGRRGAAGAGGGSPLTAPSLLAAPGGGPPGPPGPWDGPGGPSLTVQALAALAAAQGALGEDEGGDEGPAPGPSGALAAGKLYKVNRWVDRGEVQLLERWFATSGPAPDDAAGERYADVLITRRRMGQGDGRVRHLWLQAHSVRNWFAARRKAAGPRGPAFARGGPRAVPPASSPPPASAASPSSGVLPATPPRADAAEGPDAEVGAAETDEETGGGPVRFKKNFWIDPGECKLLEGWFLTNPRPTSDEYEDYASFINTRRKTKGDDRVRHHVVGKSSLSCWFDRRRRNNGPLEVDVRYTPRYTPTAPPPARLLTPSSTLTFG